MTAFPQLKDRKLPRALWPLGITMTLMLAASIVSVLVVSWTRAYAHGHAVWTMAEHRAVYELRAYAESGAAPAYQRFLQELQVPLSDRTARLELQKDHPDHALVRRSFLAGRIPAADVSGLIYLFHLFRYHPLMIRAVETWTSADSLVLDLQRTGEDLHREFASGKPDPQRLRELAARAETLHARIAPLLRDFGTTIGAAANQIAKLLLIFLPLCAVVLVAAGVAIFRALDRRAERAVQALRDLSARLEFQATHDSLTGLVNRPRFEVLIAGAIEAHRQSGQQAALLYLDLDQFKIVNDTCGHAAGDELIKQLAWRIQRLLDDGSTLARLGGDEFGLLLPQCAVSRAMQLGDQIREQICDLRFFWHERTFAVSASIGVIALDEQVSSVADALSAADQACYLAKDNGRNRVQLYRPDDSQVQLRHGEMHWVERLRAALDNDGFTLVAQEIKPLAARRRNARDSSVSARRIELLLRIADSDGQLVAPMAFIPAAERYGLMPRIDRWVIARACHELAGLRARGLQLPTCMVNISGASVSDPGLADYIAGCLQKNALAGSQLGIELTETVAVGNLDACSALMTRLRALGCLIALDDFGTGMSSFSYLRNLPIDLLKIDRAFIRNIVADPIDRALVETIQRIAGLMGVRTVAEGVETVEVLSALSLIGVDFAQGSYVHPAMPLAQIPGDPVRVGDTSTRLRILRSAAS